MKHRIESLLSARLFIAPQLVNNRVFFISNLSGHLSLYVMDYGGSVPEPLLPPNLALQNPHLLGRNPFFVFPKLDKILLMLDQDGDENYQPMLIPIEGGFPEPAFGTSFDNYRVHAGSFDIDNNLGYFFAESRTEPMNVTYRGNLATGELVKIAESQWGYSPVSHTDDHSQVLLAEGYSMGDMTLYRWQQTKGEVELVYGTPLEDRSEGQKVPLLGLIGAHLVDEGQGLLAGLALFSDTYGLGYMDLTNPGEFRPVQVTGEHHSGAGEMVALEHLKDNLYAVHYNIDGVSWLYEGAFDRDRLQMNLKYVICGEGTISNGVLESTYYEKESDSHTLSYSTAISPTQIFTVGGPERKSITLHTREKILGIPTEWLSPGEDASFTSFDGTRVSARLYMPSEALGFEGPRPVVYYIHGGPQGQERPDFAWFSMPLIQFLTLNGFAVFVPNVRGSTGYGLEYTKQVDRDWGGQDRLDHVHAMEEVLPKDNRLDVSRAGVVGRSYGGYMTLTQAARHPDLWKASVDMFGPYDLITFSERIPATWKPYFAIALGNPEVEADRQFLIERSPRTHIDNISSPMLVIQGKNDPRVVEQESRDLVEYLRDQGKEVEYLMFENEGHDVLKYENRVTCYNTITDFFAKHLKP